MENGATLLFFEHECDDLLNIAKRLIVRITLGVATGENGALYDIAIPILLDDYRERMCSGERTLFRGSGTLFHGTMIRFFSKKS